MLTIYFCTLITMALPRFFVSVVALLVVSLLATPMEAAETKLQAKSLADRVQSGGMTQCWDSLMELRACTGEVILFFLNGETYLGPSCCRAVRVIEHRCWAADAMLSALGFTTEEGHVLRGYCDAASPPPPSGVAPSPAFGSIKH